MIFERWGDLCLWCDIPRRDEVDAHAAALGMQPDCEARQAW